MKLEVNQTVRIRPNSALVLNPWSPEDCQICVAGMQGRVMQVTRKERYVQIWLDRGEVIEVPIEEVEAGKYKEVLVWESSLDTKRSMEP